MGYIVGVISQKGGVGKSTVARLLATEFARMDGGTWEVKIADLDVSQATSFVWNLKRQELGHTPAIRGEGYPRADKAVADADQFDVMILDGAPHATSETLQIAKLSNLVILPTGTALDDLRPTVKLAHELRKAKVPAERIMMCLTRTSASEAETAEARAYLTEAGYQVAEGSLAEKTGYRRASDMGLSAAETLHPSLNERARSLFGNLIKPLQSTEIQETAAA